MFMEIAIAAIGIGIVLMVGYLVVAEVKAALIQKQIDEEVKEKERELQKQEESKRSTKTSKR